ncbi:GntR family transcriptional regulator [Nesterenkonia alba]|uniref:GntR family transcriptional regulator n=1 Tax=Nesterenkonia alba TaxID=515814 RepID=UPI0003B465FB|nr:GntR family transcriptional regulator [Nesterenkonia alba]
MALGESAVPRITLPSSRIDIVLDEIRKSILTRHFEPGQPLVEAELAKNLGVSKTPVREALKILASSGLVTFEPYKGAKVRSVNEGFARDVYEVRLSLEPEAVRRSVSNASQADLDAAAVLLEDARRAGESGNYGQMSILNRKFHATLYSACGNELLVDLLDNLRDRSALISLAAWEQKPTWGKEWSEHQRMLDAAMRGEAEETAHLVKQHIEDFLERAVLALRESETV